MTSVRWMKVLVVVSVFLTLTFSYQNCEKASNQFIHQETDFSEQNVAAPEGDTSQNESFLTEPVNSTVGNGGAFQGKAFVVVEKDICADGEHISDMILSREDSYLLTKRDCVNIEPELLDSEEVEKISDSEISFGGKVFADESTIDFVQLSVDPQPSSVQITPSSSTASGHYEPARLFYDGSNQTRWNSGGYPPQWIQVDLGSPKTITQLDMIFGGLLNWEVYVGETSANRLLTSTGDGQQSWTGHETNVRYIRFLSVSGNSWVNATELKVWGY